MSTSKFKISSSVFLLSTLSALATHWYLTTQHIAVKYSAEAGSAMCNISESINCASTIMSPFSELFGIPLSIFGFVMNLFILFFGLKSLFLDQDPKKSTAITLCLALLSLSSSLIMGMVSLIIIKSLCPFCCIAYVLSFLTFWSALQWTHGFKVRIFFTYAKQLGLQLLAVALVAFVSGKVVLSSYVSAEMLETMSLIVSDWKTKSPLDIQLIDPLVLGPDSAKMKILEFSDFLCPHCKHALPKLHSFAKVHKNNVQIIFQNYPLDACSGSDTSPGKRCDLAKAAYCSQKQNKGWEAQEYLFANQERMYDVSSVDNELEKIAQEVQLDLALLKECFQNPETLKTIKAQLELGKKIGVEGTPSLFINNKAFKGGPHVPTLQEIFNSF